MLGEFKSHDEPGRQRALLRYAVLDTDEEEPFERIVRLVEQTLSVPISSVTLIDETRQWFKARRGLEVCETARDVSFCTHAIQRPEPLVVEDATEDARFSDNPLVTGAPHIRAYAGAPLITPDGYGVGALCAIDTRPRSFSAADLGILQSFATLVVGELELRLRASVDVLSGALARRAWYEHAITEVERARRFGRRLSVALLDIDHFKRVNDTLGYPAGDEVIRALSHSLSGLMRTSDMLGRVGGEEFGILLPETGGAEAVEMCERLRAAVAATRVAVPGCWPITVSIGVAELGAGQDMDSLVVSADAALYRAKLAGRNQVMLAEAVV